MAIINSRESYEKSHEAWIDSMFSRGLGDPDTHGHYPGQMDEYERNCHICHPDKAELPLIKRSTQVTTSPMNLSEQLAILGELRNATKSTYEAYKEVKSLEDNARYELEMTLAAMGLKSAKGADFSVNMVSKPTIVVRHENSVMEWLQNAPNIESDRYIGLKTTEFKSLALSLLKGTGEVIPGTEIVVSESLAIRSNTIRSNTIKENKNVALSTNPN